MLLSTSLGLTQLNDAFNGYILLFIMSERVQTRENNNYYDITHVNLYTSHNNDNIGIRYAYFVPTDFLNLLVYYYD